MTVTIKAEITKQVAMHDASEPYMLYETNLIGADGSPVLLTSRSMGRLWFKELGNPAKEVNVDESAESVHIGPDESEVVSGGGEEA